MLGDEPEADTLTGADRGGDRHVDALVADTFAQLFGKCCRDSLLGRWLRLVIFQTKVQQSAICIGKGNTMLGDLLPIPTFGIGSERK